MMASLRESLATLVLHSSTTDIQGKQHKGNHEAILRGLALDTPSGMMLIIFIGFPIVMLSSFLRWVKVHQLYLIRILSFFHFLPWR